MAINDIVESTQRQGYYSQVPNNTQLTSPTLGGAINSSLNNGVTGSLPVNFKTDVTQISDYRFGAFLRRKGIVNGDVGSIIDGAIDFIRKDATGAEKQKPISFMHERRFVPIILKTEFNLDEANNRPFYVVFDTTPDEISFSKNASWQPKDVYGRPEPIQVFSSSGSTTFSLTGKFFSDSAPELDSKLTNIANKLQALVTPSRNHLMPSPVIVKIGEWKTLRCIVTGMTVKYTGPWWISSSGISNLIDNELGNLLTQAEPGSGRSAAVVSNGNSFLRSHSPYLFEATFNFTVTSELNTTQYAEDIILSGTLDGLSFSSTNLNSSEFLDVLQRDVNSSSSLNSNEKYPNLTAISREDNLSIAYTLHGHVGDSGTVVSPTGATIGDTLGYLKSLGLPTDSNSATKLAGLAKITSGLSAEIQTAITNNYGAKITHILGK